MTLRSLLVLLLLAAAACGGGGDGSADASADASAGGPDATPTGACGAAELCLAHMPVDGVTDLPGNRLAIGWFVLEDATGEEAVEIAYDVPWSPAPLTAVALADLAQGSPAMRQPVTCNDSDTPIQVWMALIVLSTDPDGSGSVSPTELLYAYDADTRHGVGQALVVDAPVGCTSDDTFLPGVATGRHVYAGDVDQYVTLADRMAVPLVTCVPGTTACQAVEGPL